MTFVEYLEQDKERFLNALADAGTVEKSVAVIANETDRLLLKFNEECDDDVKREAAAHMLQTARISAAFADTVGEVKVWERSGSDADTSGRGGRKSREDTEKTPLLARIHLVLAAACEIGAFVIAFLNSSQSFRWTDLLLGILLVAAGIVCGVFSGKTIGRARSKKQEFNSEKYIFEKRIDAQKVYTDLHNLVYAVDWNLENLSAALNNLQSNCAADVVAGPGNVSERELDLFAGLLEAGYSGDGVYALERLGDVKLYLHRQKIEAVDYDGSNGEMFDFMPAKDAKTLRPALVAEGRVLKRGLAAGAR